ncbi:MAG: hypothetical protein HYX69_11155 [Planctomycetia bacterium]|nr:hypothetical protein [Planctomycetia bacterium]
MGGKPAALLGFLGGMIAGVLLAVALSASPGARPGADDRKLTAEQRNVELPSNPGHQFNVSRWEIKRRIEAAGFQFAGDSSAVEEDDRFLDRLSGGGILVGISGPAAQPRDLVVSLFYGPNPTTDAASTGTSDMLELFRALAPEWPDGQGWFSQAARRVEPDDSICRVKNRVRFEVKHGRGVLSFFMTAQ